MLYRLLFLMFLFSVPQYAFAFGSIGRIQVITGYSGSADFYYKKPDGVNKMIRFQLKGKTEKEVRENANMLCKKATGKECRYIGVTAIKEWQPDPNYKRPPAPSSADYQNMLKSYRR